MKYFISNFKNCALKTAIAIVVGALIIYGIYFIINNDNAINIFLFLREHRIIATMFISWLTITSFCCYMKYEEYNYYNINSAITAIVILIVIFALQLALWTPIKS